VARQQDLGDEQSDDGEQRRCGNEASGHHGCRA
jgi:hypothetical protein